MTALRIIGLVLGALLAIAILAYALRDPSQVPPYAYLLFVFVMAAGLAAHWASRKRRQKSQ